MPSTPGDMQGVHIRGRPAVRHRRCHSSTPCPASIICLPVLTTAQLPRLSRLTSNHVHWQGWGTLICPHTHVTRHRPQPKMGRSPHQPAKPESCPLTASDPPPPPPPPDRQTARQPHTHTDLIHLGLGLLQPSVTGEVWRGCGGASLPSRSGRGDGGSGGRPEGRGRLGPRVPGLQPRSRGSAHPPVRPLTLARRKTTRHRPAA